jgi:hypothetical protein
MESALQKAQTAGRFVGKNTGEWRRRAFFSWGLLPTESAEERGLLWLAVCLLQLAFVSEISELK